MTRKDYIAIAEALRKASGHAKIAPLATDTAEKGIALAVDHITLVLAADNPHFDREHFLAVVRGERDLNSRPAHKRPKLIECGACGCYHPRNFVGDCRDDANRYPTPDYADARA